MPFDLASGFQPPNQQIAIATTPISLLAPPAAAPVVANTPTVPAPINLTAAVGNIPPPAMPGAPIDNPVPANAPPPVGGNKFEKPGVSGSATSGTDRMIAEREAQRTAAQGQLDELGKETHQLLDQLRNMGGRDADTMRQLAEARRKMEEYSEKALELAAHPPQPPTPQQAMHNFGGIATVLGIFGGLLTRQPLMASLNAGAAAMRAYNANDQRTYQEQLAQWKFHSDTLLKMAEFQQQMLRDTLYDEHTSMTEKMATLNAQLSAIGNLRLQAMAMSGNDAKLFDAETKLDRLVLEYQKHKDQVENAPNKWELMGDPTKPDQQGNPQAFRYNPATGQSTDMSGNPYSPGGAVKLTSSSTPPPVEFPDKWPGMPDKPPPGVQGDVWSGALFYARTHQMPTFGMKAGLREQIFRAVPAAMHALGINPSEAADVAAGYAGERHGAIVTSGRAAQLGMAINEAKQFLPMAVDASEKVSRTQYPHLNSIIEAYQRGTGGENIVRFAVATNALSNAYAQVATRGGQSTDAARAQANKILDEAYSKGQFATAADQMMKEIQAAQAAPAAAWQDIRRAFDAGRGLGGGGAANPTATAPATAPGAVPVPSAHAGGIPHVNNQAQYDALPAGAQYVGPDGKTRTKQ